MKIALIITGSVLALLLILSLALLFLPVSVFIKFKEDFFVKIKFFGIKVYEIPQKKDKKDKTPKEISDKKAEKNEEKAENIVLSKAKSFFGFFKKKYGFFGAVKKLLGFFNDALTHIKPFLRHIKVKKVILNLVISGDDAADTAIKYGQVCTAVYPVLSFFESVCGVDFKKINVKSDFTDNKNEFDFSLLIKLKIFYLLKTAFKVYKEYKNFTLKENYNER
ncbi:MAG: DUF2953 domain-containing protein [Clostridia bacterium]|nr:DUF2953 domain-containing protein [Clostridia bacterium]